MPWKAKKPCLEPGCPALVERGYCPKHRRAKALKDRRKRGSAAQRGYDREWRELRDAYAAEHPLCEDCLAEGRRRKMRIVDHKQPIKLGGARLDWKNLRSLCWSCHEKKKARERSG